MDTNKVIVGECSEILCGFPEEIIDMTITSPPYGSARSYKGFTFNCDKISKELFRVTKVGGVVVWVEGDEIINGGESCSSFKSALNFVDNGFRLHDTMIYEKNTSSFPARRTGNRYTQIFEYMFVFSKGKPKTCNLICDKENRWKGWVNWGKKTHRNKEGELVKTGDIKPVPSYSPRNNLWKFEVTPEVILSSQDEETQEEFARTNVWRYVVGAKYGQKDVRAYKHPATFPMDLAKDHILTWSNEGDLVLDPMCGSGTSCIAAKNLKRNYIGIDISEEYCELTKERLS